MNIHPKVYLFLIFFILITSCEKKESDVNSWDGCYSCTIDSWVGEFTGTCNYYNSTTNLTVSDLPFNLTIEETATEYLTAYIVVPNYYSTSISGEFTNPNYISFGGSTSSLSANMYTQDSKLRLTGNSKKYHFKIDSIIIDQVINFESLKQVQQ